MSHKQMQERCPNSKFIRKAFLKDYTFVYDGYSKKRKGAVANIIESPGRIVWGCLYDITEDNIKKLDEKEGYPYSYKKKDVPVFDDDGNVYTAIVYLRTGREHGTPSKDYRNTVLEGARDCGLDAKYIRDFLDVKLES